MSVFMVRRRMLYRGGLLFYMTLLPKRSAATKRLIRLRMAVRAVRSFVCLFARSSVR